MSKLLLIFSYFCYILGSSYYKNGVKYIHNEWIIYTNVRRENLEISYMLENDKTIHLFKMREVTSYIKPENFLIDSYVYLIEIPDANDFTMFYKIKNSDEKGFLSYKSKISFKAEIGSEHLAINNAVIDDASSTVHEIGFTRFLYQFKSRYVCVIGDKLENKVRLDKSLEFCQINIIAEEIRSLEEEIIKLTKNIGELSLNPIVPCEAYNILMQIKTGIIISAINQHVTLRISLLNYNSSKYEASISNDSILSPRDFIFDEYNRLFTRMGDELILKKNFDSVKKYLTDANFTEKMNQLELSINKVNFIFVEIKNFLISVEKINDYHYSGRNDEYIKKFNFHLEETELTQIKCLRDNYRNFEGYILINYLCEYLSVLFMVIHKPNPGDTEIFNDKSEEVYPHKLINIETLYKILINYECLFSREYLKYFEELKNDKRFKSLDSKRVLEFLEKAKELFIYLNNYALFPTSLEDIISSTELMIEEWTKIREDDTNVGFFTQDNSK